MGWFLPRKQKKIKGAWKKKKGAWSEMSALLFHSKDGS
jgi:hypothetical protein